MDVRFGRWEQLLLRPLPTDPFRFCVTTATAQLARALAYGAPRPHPLLYTKAFVAHALAVMRTVPCERLLLIDIVGGGSGYRELGAFLRVTPPNEPFPDLKPPPTTDKVRVFDVL